MWRTAGEASGGRDGTSEPFKRRKGFGSQVRQARARLSNTTIRDLLFYDRFTEAVLVLMGATRVGE